MAMTETRPETDAPAEPPPGEPVTDAEAVLGTGDHKTLGRLWIALSSLFILAGLAISAVAGFERIDLQSFTLVDDAEMYGQLWALGRETLVVLGVIPLLVGLATYLVPLQVGASTLAFARGAAGAFWTWLLSGAVLVAAYVLNGGVAGGRQDFTALWAVAYGGVLVALLWALVCVLVTILGLRTTGMTLDRTPISTWSFLVFGTVGLATLSVMVAELVTSWIRISHGDLDAAGPRLALAGVTDQVTMAPGVFWLAIPVLGLAAEALTTHAGLPLLRHRAVMGLLGAVGVLAFGAHVLSFQDLRGGAPLDNGLVVVQLLALPAVVLAVLALTGDTARRGPFRFRSAVLAGAVGGALLLLASVAVLLAQVEHILRFIDDVTGASIDVPSWLDLSGSTLHDGVRVLVVGAALVAGIGALQHWGHKIYGRALDESLGLSAVAAVAAGAVVWGVAEVVTGMLEQPRGPLIVPRNTEVEIINGVAMAGAALMALGAALVLANLVLSTLAGRGSEREPWRGLTLEWATPSPPPLGNFPEPPVVRSGTPLADPPLEEEAR
jgi:hypothetical protein